LAKNLRSKRSRTTRTKFGPREGVFSHSGCPKNEAPSTFLLSANFSRGLNAKTSFAQPEFRLRRSGTLATQAMEMTTATLNGPRGEFYFINHNEGIYSFR